MRSGPHWEIRYEVGYWIGEGGGKRELLVGRASFGMEAAFPLLARRATKKKIVAVRSGPIPIT
ncbi:hypothetical protein DSM3645_15425 [Blastopirellula marina DSM 3645]|uniref:Uncharacterized protein n=1 Tax=Blastopirellula marina DSM 3645 TaxID=314230 RepID=A3ZZ85_9BACT|nr:hypothetical protein DSM3645_15425 [Blastopirellula marina DSM 3645]